MARAVAAMPDAWSYVLGKGGFTGLLFAVRKFDLFLEAVLSVQA